MWMSVLVTREKYWTDPLLLWSLHCSCSWQPARCSGFGLEPSGTLAAAANAWASRLGFLVLVEGLNADQPAHSARSENLRRENLCGGTRQPASRMTKQINCRASRDAEGLHAGQECL